LVLDPSMEEAVDELINGTSGLNQAGTCSNGIEENDTAFDDDQDHSGERETSDSSEEEPDAQAPVIRCLLVARCPCTSPTTVLHAHEFPRIC
jgi:hypothetical protein